MKRVACLVIRKVSVAMKVYIVENKPEKKNANRVLRKVKVKANAFLVDKSGGQDNSVREMVFKVTYDLGDGWEIAMAVVGQGTQEEASPSSRPNRFQTE